MNKMVKGNNKLEMWKIKRVISWLDCVFDTCFLAFVWIMGWKVFFWIYMVTAILSLLGNAGVVAKLEKSL